jgi:hypothetical protein
VEDEDFLWELQFCALDGGGLILVSRCRLDLRMPIGRLITYITPF